MLISDCTIKKVKISTRMVFKMDWCGSMTDKFTGDALVSMDVLLANQGETPAEGTLRAVFTAPECRNFEKTVSSRSVTLAPGEELVKMSVTIPQAALWSVWDYGTPNLYQLKLEYGEASYTCRIGLKEVAFDEKHGKWSINRERVYLRGAVIEKEDADPVWLKEQGINAVLVKDQAVGEAFYDACDENGILVWEGYGVSAEDMTEKGAEAASARVVEAAKRVLNHASHGVWSLEIGEAVYSGADLSNMNMALCGVIYESLKAVDPVKPLIMRTKVQNRMESVFASERMRKLNPRTVKLPSTIACVGLPGDTVSADEEAYLKWEAEYLRSHKYDPVSAIFVRNCETVRANCMKPVLVAFEPGYETENNARRVSVCAGASFTCRVWAVNDFHHGIEDVRLSWKITSQDGRQAAGNAFRLNLNPDSAEIPDHVIFPVPEGAEGEVYTLTASLESDQELLATNSMEIAVCK